jgi:predicted nucleic acid-binding protein
MKKVVVDANVAVKWVINEHDSGVALDLLRDWAKNEVAILAPMLLASETTNILYRAVKSEKLLFNDAKVGIEEIIFPAITFDVVHIHTSEFFIRIMHLAKQFHLPATYDVHYLALAEREQCEFWTADMRLYNSVKEQLPWVRLMADD